jgi:hypothetical protein
MLNLHKQHVDLQSEQIKNKYPTLKKTPIQLLPPSSILEPPSSTMEPLPTSELQQTIR